MAFFDKLKFWKKKDDFADLGLKGAEAGLGADLGLPDTGIGRPELNPDLGLGPEPFRQEPMQPQFQQQPYNYPQPSPQPPTMMPQQPVQESRDNIEVVSSKLDVIKAKLDSVEQRLANIERIAQSEQEEHRRKTW